MRWNCPHCWSALAIADEKMPDGWAFSRCFKCAGFALVRQGARNIIKVDSAPAGERVLQAEARVEAREDASLTKQARPVVKTVNRSRLKPVAAPVPESSITNEVRSSAISEVAAAIKQGGTPQVLSPNSSSDHAPFALNSLSFPQPLPEPPLSSARSRALPFLIGLTAALAVGSTAFLYAQGQRIFTPARHVITPVVSEATHPMQEHESIRQIATPPSAANTLINDQVRQQAMAPMRAPATSPNLVVRPKTKGVNLRQGPGTVFPVAGASDENLRYVVIDWSDKWFKVTPENEAESSPHATTGWIRTDTVQVVTAE